MNQSVFTNSEIRGIRRWFGAAIAVLAVTILLMNIEVTSFGFFRIGPLNSAPILVITLVLFIIWAVISSKRFPWIMVAINILLILVSVLLGTHFVLRRMTAFTLVVIIAMLGIGIGLYVLGCIRPKKED
ncbi:MAG: hypothetical protein IJM83_01085 [Firmicutes bacterium]|nr:hypothetical protein [Bacillota bacterium]